MRKYKVKAKSKKYEFTKREIIFFRYKISESMLRTKKNTIDKIMNILMSKTLKKIKLFVSYYKKFIQNFTKIVRLLMYL